MDRVKKFNTLTDSIYDTQNSEITWDDKYKTVEEFLANYVLAGYAENKFALLKELLPSLFPCKNKLPFACEELSQQIKEALEEIKEDLHDNVIEPLKEKSTLRVVSDEGTDGFVIIKESDFSGVLEDTSGASVASFYTSFTYTSRYGQFDEDMPILAITRRHADTTYFEVLGADYEEYVYPNNMVVYKFTSLTEDTTIESIEDTVTFTSIEGTSTIGVSLLPSNQQLFYKIPGQIGWKEFLHNTNIPLEEGNSVFLKGIITSNNNGSTQWTQFNITGKVAVSGNINYLWNYKNLQQPLFEYCGFCLFKHCEIVDASGLIIPTANKSNCYNSLFYGCAYLSAPPQLPATELGNSCYSDMFLGCYNLSEMPQLPALELASYCYAGMFYGCTSLTEAIILPATTLATGCYQAMFNGCSNLNTVPQNMLPATKLATLCYFGMFYNCTNLTTAPELLANVLPQGCYEKMFYGCSSLNYIKCLATDITTYENCTVNWVDGVSNSGTFVKQEGMEDWPIDNISGIPIGWTAIEPNTWVEIARYDSYETDGAHTLNIKGFSKLGFFVVGGGGSGHGDFNWSGHSGNGGNGGQVRSFIVSINGNQCTTILGAGGSGCVSQSSSNPGSASSITYNGVTYTADGGYGGTNDTESSNRIQEYSGIGGRYCYCMQGVNVSSQSEAEEIYNLASTHIATDPVQTTSFGVLVYGAKGANGLPNPFDPLDTNLYGAGGAGGFNANKSYDTSGGGAPKAISGGDTNGGSGGYGNDNTAENTGTHATFYGAGGGGGAFSSEHTYSNGGAGGKGIIIVYAAVD